MAGGGNHGPNRSCLVNRRARQSRQLARLFFIVVACDVIVAQFSVAHLGQLTVLSRLVTLDVVEQQRALLGVVIVTLV